jgi:C1A family cysteine protease
MMKMHTVLVSITLAAYSLAVEAQDQPMAHAPVPTAVTVQKANDIGMEPALLEKLLILKEREPDIQVAATTATETPELPMITTSTNRQVQLIPLSLMTDSPSLEPRTNAVPQVARFEKYVNRPTLRLVTKEIDALDLSAPPPKVDHRSKQTQIRTQGTRGTCVAHAVAAALERRDDVPDDLSEQYAFHSFMLKEHLDCCSGTGLRTIDAAVYASDEGIPEEQDWKYDIDPPNCGSSTSCTAPTHDVPAAATTARKYRIAKFELINDLDVDNDGTSDVTGPTIKNPAYLESILASGNDIVFGTYVAWDEADATGVLDVKIDPDTGSRWEPYGGHAMLLVGYNRPGGYFIAKNSWGPDWGHGGYAYLTYDYIRAYAKYGFIITDVLAEPPAVEAAPASHQPAGAATP